MESTLRSLRAFVDVVRSAPLAVVATVDPGGRPEAALVSIAADDRGDLLFTTATDARKVVNLGHAARIAVVVGCVGETSLQVEGEASVQVGEARLEAARAYLDVFPASRVLEPGFSVVRVRPDWVRHYDTGPTPPAVEEGRPAWAR